MSARVVVAAAVFLTMALCAGAARAEGVLLSPSRLRATERATLLEAIGQARQAHPEAFAAIRRLKGHKSEVYGKTRASRPDVSHELQALGPGAAWAIVDAIAFSPLQRERATDEEWDAVGLGLVGVLSDLRMAQASPVLARVFEAKETSEPVRRAAAVGLGKLGSGVEKSILVGALAHSDGRRDAALWGLRHVRAPEVVEAVAALLGSGVPEQTARTAATTLGYQGSSWAWATGRAGEAKDEEPIRRRCTDVLLDSYLRYEGEGREYSARGMQMVEYRSALEMIAEARASRAASSDQRLLDELAKRLRAAWRR